MHGRNFRMESSIVETFLILTVPVAIRRLIYAKTIIFSYILLSFAKSHTNESLITRDLQNFIPNQVILPSFKYHHTHTLQSS